jgi:hypothetical protein
MNRTYLPAATDEILYSIRVLMFFSVVLVGYSLSRPLSTSQEQDLPAANDTTLQPWQEKASAKAIERYAASQGRKWQKWNEAMFERSD